MYMRKSNTCSCRLETKRILSVGGLGKVGHPMHGLSVALVVLAENGVLVLGSHLAGRRTLGLGLEQELGSHAQSLHAGSQHLHHRVDGLHSLSLAGLLCGRQSPSVSLLADVSFRVVGVWMVDLGGDLDCQSARRA